MDIPRPAKKFFGEPYKKLTVIWEDAIAVALNLPYETHYKHQIIKQADNFALLVEARSMMPSGGRRWDYLKELDGLPKRIVIPDYFYGEQDWKVSRDAFLQRHEELTHAA